MDEDDDSDDDDDIDDSDDPTCIYDSYVEKSIFMIGI